MADHADNLVLGRGRLYFERFADGARVGTGAERYLGSTPELTASESETNLDHYSMEGGRKTKDRSVTIQNDSTLAFTTDNIDRENVAMWYFGETVAAVLAAGSDLVTTITAKRGTYFQLGMMTAALPSGSRNVSSVVATDDADVVIAAEGNFEVDAALGRIYILPDAAGIADDDEVTFTFDSASGTELQVIPGGKQVFGALRFIADNEVGENHDRYWPYVKLAPDGDHSLKGDDWQVMGFSAEVLKRDASTPACIITVR